MTAKPPITEKVKGLRQRQRADGSWRIWWEPKDYEKQRGFDSVTLDASRLTWSVRRAKELNAEVDRFSDGETRRTGGCTMAHLIRRYKKAPKWGQLKPATQADYTEKMNTIEDKWGPEPAIQFTKPVMHEWYETLYRTRGAHRAKSLIRMMSILFSYAELIGWRPEDSNPCFRLQLVDPKPRNRVVGWGEFDALVQTALDRERFGMALALRLALFTGQRQTDLIQARCRDFFQHDTGVWVWDLERSKRGNADLLPLHDELARLIDARIRPDTDGDAPLLLDRHDRPFTKWSFRDDFRDVRAAVADSLPVVATLQFRDLRRTFGVMSRQGGATRDDTGDVLGNSLARDARLARTYTPAVRETVQRAINAIQRPPVRR